MSSDPLSPDNDYQFPPAPAPAVMDREKFNALTASIAARLRAVEAQRTELEDLINDLSFNAQARVDAAIAPVIAGVQEQLTVAQQEVTAMQAANAAIISDFQAVTAVNLEELSESIATLEGQIASIQTQFNAILAGQVPAANVTESGTRVFLTPAQKAEISQLRTDLGGKIPDTDGSVDGDNLAPGSVSLSKINSSVFATQDSAKAGSGDGLMNPALVAAAIGSLAGHVTKQVFTQSGTFTKEEDDIFYFVECWGGGGSGHAYCPSSTQDAYGGNGGYYNQGFFLASELTSPVAVLVGSGGASRSAAQGQSVPGISGGSSSFGNVLLSQGGLGGQLNAGDTGTFHSFIGGTGGFGPQTRGGGSVKGGGGGAGVRIQAGGSVTSTGAGASDSAGAGGAAGNTGAPGSIPSGGGGAGGGSGACTSGAGARGEVRVLRFKRKKP